jgi:hypothetical protein
VVQTARMNNQGAVHVIASKGDTNQNLRTRFAKIVGLA